MLCNTLPVAFHLTHIYIYTAAVLIAHSLAPAMADNMATTQSAQFAAQQAERISLLSHAMYDALIRPDYGEYLGKTGSLVKDRNLRTKASRVAFNQILSVCSGKDNSRFWTTCVVKKAIKSTKNESVSIFLFLHPKNILSLYIFLC